MSLYARGGKRALDLVLTAAALFFLSPVILTVGSLVAITVGWPIFFAQLRPGLKGELFRIVKFRTMHDRRDSAGQPLPDHERLPRFGAWLRASSLDELPELWNVLRGQMSLVGPRPLLPEYLERYRPEHRVRHDVLPGITGWAQVNGRNDLTWDEKFDMDVWYVDNVSFLLDLRIIVRTLGDVVRRRGISAEGHATMPPFLGDSRGDDVDV